MFKNRSSRAANKLAKQQQEQQKASAPKREYYVESSHHRIYCCITCRAHLANNDELISKLFQGNHGRAYLFNKVVNVGCKPAVERELLTGLHAVADIYCESCQTLLGWRYTKAFVDSQKYKEGKFILEEHNLLKQSSWDLTSYNVDELLIEHDDEAAEEPSSNRKSSRASIRDRDSGKRPTASNDAVGSQSAGLKQTTPDFVVIEVQAAPAAPAAPERNSNKHSASQANGNRIGTTQRANQMSDNDNENHSSNSVDRCSLERGVAGRRQSQSLTSGPPAGERGQQPANSSASSSLAPSAVLPAQDTLAKRSLWLPFESTAAAAERGVATPSQS